MDSYVPASSRSGCLWAVSLVALVCAWFLYGLLSEYATSWL